ncbi:hypothetical protein [Anabaena sp. CCY 0017]|uniref:hypothetical protein n=1 Tax=Anabaena sp. CCY 0017 TaxID=3103866 RepID=UPI0039C74A29
MGDSFSLDVLAIIYKKSPSLTANDLYPALQAGLILPLSEAYRIPLVFNQAEAINLTFDSSRVGYKFLHDRVQQAHATHKRSETSIDVANGTYEDEVVLVNGRWKIQRRTLKLFTFLNLSSPPTTTSQPRIPRRRSR